MCWKIMINGSERNGGFTVRTYFSGSVYGPIAGNVLLT
jgi:hypothetical protein